VALRPSERHRESVRGALAADQHLIDPVSYQYHCPSIRHLPSFDHICYPNARGLVVPAQPFLEVGDDLLRAADEDDPPRAREGASWPDGPRTSTQGFRGPDQCVVDVSYYSDGNADRGSLPGGR